ncbi:MAG: hypothetical protein Q7T86_03300 [Hyphomicrobiaceae bacterium]|nr:hypothetical protein [Hyphomicrobiaceae bacterium]
MTGNVVALKVGGPIMGIVPQNIDEIFRLATGIAKSGLAPPSMATAEKLMVAIMTGLELGLPPMFAINKIAVINGKPTLWGDAIPALLWSRGFKLKEWGEGEGSGLAAVCSVTRPDGSTIERRFDVQDAIAAGLWGKAGPWKQYPARMLQMRARGFAARDGAADVLGGLYLREELEDEQMKDITPAPAEVPMPPEMPDEPDTAEAEFLSKLRTDANNCESEAELIQLGVNLAGSISQLSADGQAEAVKILAVE